MQIILGDITKIKADAIVNAASTDLMPHPGICGAIYAAADGMSMLLLLQTMVLDLRAWLTIRCSGTLQRDSLCSSDAIFPLSFSWQSQGL